MISNKQYNSIEHILTYYGLKIVPTKMYGYILGIFFKKIMQKDLDLKNPKTLSEKIQYIKLFEKNDLKTLLTDKIEAKKYVKNLIPTINVPQIYAESDNFCDIDWQQLPNIFVLKTNHACKTNILIDNKSKVTKSEYDNYVKYYNYILHKNFSFYGFLELQYKNIVPRIFAEEYIGEGNFRPLQEYEIWCFHGEPLIIRYTISANSSESYFLKAYHYDVNWNKLDFDIFFSNEEIIPKPKNLDKILDYARILSQNINFVRVDLTEVNDKIYFGEMTFTPYSGFIKFIPEKYDLIYGEKLKIAKL